MSMKPTASRRQILAAGVCAGVLAFGLAPAQADTYPAQPIRVLIPTDPGGAIDGTARVFQRAFEEMGVFGHPMAIINMAGAGGTVATRALKDAEPDGYTLAFWHDGLVTSNAMGVVDYDHSAFEIIGGTGFAQLGLAVGEDGRFKTFEELLEFARENPGEVTVAANIGLPVHFVPMQVAVAADVDFRFVQAGGGARRYQSLVGNHTDIALFSVQELVQFDDAGLDTILMLTEERIEAFPDVPTGRELGLDVVANSARIWLAPAGTPPERLEILRDAFREAIAREDVAQQLVDFGLEPEFIEPETVLGMLDATRENTLPLVERARQIQQ